MTKVKLIGLITLLFLSTVLPARAEGVAKSQTYVVLIGVGQYSDPQIKPRPKAEADAKALYDLVTDANYLAAGKDNVRLLLGTEDKGRGSQPATHENILKAFQWVAGKAGRDDLVLLAYFGQGAALADRTCYFGTDSTYKDRAKTAVTALEVEKTLEKMKSQSVCILLDVPFTQLDLGKDPVPSPQGDHLYQEFLGSDEEKVPVGRVLFLSGVTSTIGSGRSGAFAKATVEALQGAADKDGYEPDGLVTVDELDKYLAKELNRTVRFGDRSCNFSLTRNPPVAAKVSARVRKFDSLVESEKIAKDIAEEGRELLSRMPRLKAMQDLRKEYARLADGELKFDEFKAKRDETLAGLKLRRSLARAYAAKVIQATQTLRDNYVKEVNQGELVAWAIRGLYRRVDERIPADLRERVDKASKLNEEQLTGLLTDARERLGKREDLENHKDIDYSLQRMMVYLDPYTTYVDPESLARFRQETSGRFTGIGIQISQNRERNLLEVATPIKGSPAYRAGVKAGDLILSITRAVDNTGKKLDPPEVISTKGLTTGDAVKKIQGRRGTKVRLTVERKTGDATETLEFDITRDEIEVESVFGVKRQDNDDWDYLVDRENKIAYVRLSSFADNTARDLARVLKQLDKQGVKGFILDLRNNPGGLLTSAVEISDMFIDDGLIVSIRPRTGRPSTYRGESEGSYLNFPMACLVNGHSASGSEIVAACLQDHQRAIIVGERSFGKGSVQNISNFDGGQMKLTTATFWRPNGKNLNKSSTAGKAEEDWGVVPDKGYVQAVSDKELSALLEQQHDVEIIRRRDAPAKSPAKPEAKDRQLDTALEYLRSQIKPATKVADKKAG